MSDTYKNTVFLPRTTFPMRADLPTREPLMLARWQSMGLYAKLRKANAHKPTYIVHDGPPYANGHLHMGHALNKILKDVVLKSYQLKGFNTPFVPGWDCHGLPIEWQIEEHFRQQGRTKETIPVVEFRDACRADALKWMGVQNQEAQRLGVLGDWDNPYTTLDPAAEAVIVGELLAFLMQDQLYLGEKPIMWSVVEKTALAEAEVEYKDKTSTSIYIRFPIQAPEGHVLHNSSAAVWTTTPWTLPGNRAVAFNPTALYALIEVQSDVGLLKAGDRLVVAQDLVANFTELHNNVAVTTLATFPGTELSGLMLHHPLFSQGFELTVPFLAGKHVTLDCGTGLVHTAPGHGEDDFYLGKAAGLDVPKTLGDDGVFFDTIPLLAGTHVFKADPIVVEALTQAGTLLSRRDIVHSYPHSWRSKAPLIFRTTPQWFMSMAANDLRAKALAAIDATRWAPEQGRNRIRAMVEQRPDWCLSRQRSWGVPLPFFTHRTSGAILKDPRVNARIMGIIETEGTDAWYIRPTQDFIEGYVDNPADWIQVMDSVDVWFDSGCTQAFVLKKNPALTWPADAYIEGSDQHRGWFQSSLLVACGIEGSAPYKNVVTHGFVVDAQGHKMSKSVGNVMPLDSTLAEYGADILRLWVINSDYREDLRIGKDILRLQQDLYRRFRNTLRYLLGSLHGFDATEIVPYEDLPALERYILHRLTDIEQSFSKACDTLYFQEFLTQLHTFCAVDLSAFYFDVRKDAVYCDAASALRRRSARTVMHHLLTHLMHFLSPILSFTAEEAYLSSLEAAGKTSEDLKDASIFLVPKPDMPQQWVQPALASTWTTIRDLRRGMTGALEESRAKGAIGSSLQAQLFIHGSYEYLQYLEGVDLKELAIVSGATLVEGEVPSESFQLPGLGIGVNVRAAVGEKCLRCWTITPEVGSHADHPDLCTRCYEVMQ